MGERHRLRRDEADRRANRRRHDHLDDSRPHTGAGILRNHEGARIEAWKAVLMAPISRQKTFIFNAGGGGRTRTELSLQRILSPLRMPFRHPGVSASMIVKS